MGRLNRMFLSRREFFTVSGVAVTAAAAASVCMKQGANLLGTAAAVKKQNTMPVVVVGAGLGQF